MTKRFLNPWIPCATLALALAQGAHADLSVMHHHENPMEIKTELPGTPIDLIGGAPPQPHPKTPASNAPQVVVPVAPPVLTPVAPPVLTPVAPPATTADADPTSPKTDAAPAASALPTVPAIKAQVEPPIIVTVPAEVPEPPDRVEYPPVKPVPLVRVSETHAAPPPRATAFHPSSPGLVVRSSIVSPFSGKAPTVTALTPSIFFGSGQTRVSPTSMSDLDQVGHKVRAALSDPGLRLVVTGYTDSAGSAETNKRIATQRARSVAQALIARFSLPPWRIMVRGAGEDLARVSSNPYSGVHRRAEVTLVRDGPNSDTACVMTGPNGGAPIKGTLVASRFDSIDDYGGGRLTEYCGFITHSN